MGILTGLRPEKVFSYFEKLCSVPHGSGNTKIISDLCVEFAKELKLPWRQDEANNVVIWKPASAGYEAAEPVILQGHLDMVCTKTESCPKDLTKDGLDLATDGEWIWAKETSLGGDNCIAVAMILAILADETLAHPPIEAVFTVDEEVGLLGAFALDCSDLKGRKLINLDSEEEGIFTVSCAGGVRLDCRIPVIFAPVVGQAGYRVELSGLLGGHSGADIDKGRAAANHLMGRILYQALREFPDLRVAEFRGGEFDNVISSRCTARLAVNQESETAFAAFMAQMEQILKNEYKGCDDGLTLCCTEAEVLQAADGESTRNILRALFVLPQGVQAMNMDFPGLVQTSLNLGIISMDEDALCFSFSVRSCIASQKEMLVEKVIAIVEKAGGSVGQRGNYPGWQYNRNSSLRETMLAAYREISGKEGVAFATHGGLECGLFVDRLPGLDAISLGPDLQDVHSVRERLNVASTARVYRLLCEVLHRC